MRGRSVLGGGATEPAYHDTLAGAGRGSGSAPGSAAASGSATQDASTPTTQRTTLECYPISEDTDRVVTRGLGLVLVLASACTTIELVPRPRPPAPPADDVSLGLTIATTTLRDGLRVVTVTDPTAHEVQVTMRYAVGAANDGAS